MGWDVVTTLKEPLPLTLAFVAHHLANKAERIHLYFDDPADPAIALLRDLETVTITRCDTDYWDAAGGRPNGQTERQRYNANRAKADCTADWLLHCDADEFLMNTDLLAYELDALPDEVCVASMRVRERCFVGTPDTSSILAGWYRAPITHEKRLQRIYGAMADELKSGMLGYPSVKSFTRPRTDLEIAVHRSYGWGPKGRYELEVPRQRLRLESDHLLHVDGLTPLQARHKMLAKLRKGAGKAIPAYLNDHRQAQIASYMQGMTATEDYFYRMRTIPDEGVALMRKIGKLQRIKVDLTADARARWPELGLTFSQEELDRHLLEVSPMLASDSERDMAEPATTCGRAVA